MHVRGGSGAPLLQGMPAREVVVASNARLGVDSIEADRTEPRPNNVVGDPRLDKVMCGSGPNMHRWTAMGDVVPAPGFLGAMDPRVVGPGLSGSLGSLPHLSTRGRWRIVQSRCVRRLHLRTGCCRRH
jgi:hypothetical protein